MDKSLMWRVILILAVVAVCVLASSPLTERDVREFLKVPTCWGGGAGMDGLPSPRLSQAPPCDGVWPLITPHFFVVLVPLDCRRNLFSVFFTTSVHG